MMLTKRRYSGLGGVRTSNAAILDGCSHASHRMSQQNWSGKSELLNKSNDIAGVISVAIAIQRCARIAVPSSVGHYYVVVSFESACQTSHDRWRPLPCSCILSP